MKLCFEEQLQNPTSGLFRPSMICGLNDTVKAGGSVINASSQTQFQDGLVLVQSNICLSTRFNCLYPCRFISESVGCFAENSLVLFWTLNRFCQGLANHLDLSFDSSLWIRMLLDIGSDSLGRIIAEALSGDIWFERVMSGQ